MDAAVKISLALHPMGSVQKPSPIRRSTAAYAPPEVAEGKPPVYPYTPISFSFKNAETPEEETLYIELQSAVHAIIERLEYSFTFYPSLLTIPKRQQQVAETWSRPKNTSGRSRRKCDPYEKQHSIFFSLFRHPTVPDAGHPQQPPRLIPANYISGVYNASEWSRSQRSSTSILPTNPKSASERGGFM